MNISRSKNYANLNSLKSLELTFCRRPERQNEQNVVKIVYTAEPQLIVSSLQQRQCVFLDSGQCFVSLFWAADGSYVHSYFDLSTTITSPQRHSKPLPHDTAFRLLSLYLCAVNRMSCTNSTIEMLHPRKSNRCHTTSLSPHNGELCTSATFLCPQGGRVRFDCDNNNASIYFKPERGTPGICKKIDFSEECLVKIPTVGPQNVVKSDQISPTFQRLIF